MTLNLDEEEEAVGGLWDIEPAGNDQFVHFGGKMMRDVLRGRRRWRPEMPAHTGLARGALLLYSVVIN